MILRIAALAALLTGLIFGQDASPVVTLTDAPPVIELQPDMNDPGVLRAQLDLERTKQLIGQGALPMIRLRKAQQALEEAKDMSMLRTSFYAKDLLPEQAEQMVIIAQKMVLRKKQSLIEMQQLVDAGIISRSEGEASAADMARAQSELQLAQSRAEVLQQMADALRREKAIASLETQAESHPDWYGKVYTRYDGNGIFTPADFQRISMAFAARFSRSIPVSADGETATHRALGFDHRGRIDVALNPDQPEGAWLLRYLEKNKIPYFAFRMAVARKATGAHIHIGPQSTRLVQVFAHKPPLPNP